MSDTEPERRAVDGPLVESWPGRLRLRFRRLESRVESRYNIKFRVFAGLYVVSFVPFYLGIVLAAKGAFEKSAALIATGILVNRAAWALPYLYPFVFGTLPKRAKVAISVWMVLGVAYGVISMSAAYR